MTDVTIVTHVGLARGSEDDRILAEAFANAGASVRVAAWDDDRIDWSASDITIVRSAWDYHFQRGPWFSWVYRISSQTQLVNPAQCLAWNSDKTYLVDLEMRGVPIVPTLLIDKNVGDIVSVCRERNWNDVVIKPAIAASGFGAARFNGASLGEAQRHAAALLSHSKVLIQPYQEEVETEGERSLIFVDGRLSHAFTKPPFLTRAGNLDGLASHPASEEEVNFARSVILSAPVNPVYARVALLSSADRLRLMELELIQPTLAFRLLPEGAASIARSILAHRFARFETARWRSATPLD